MRQTLLLLFLLSLNLCPAQTPAPIPPNTPETLEKPYVVMVSIDGFRHDYIELHKAQNLARIASEGIRAESMLPSFPSLTFPNHYTLVTGLYPQSHGLVANTFFDPARKETYRIGDRTKVEDGTWYSGTPLWNLAEQQGMRSACYYWVGSESAIGNMRPSWYYKYNEKTPNAERVTQISAWLALPDSIRPHMITLYFSVVDHQGHEFGPEAPETYTAVQEIDSLIGVLDRNITATGLPVNLIVVSDHGMERIDTQNPIDISKLDFGSTQVVKGGNMWMLYSKDSAEVERVYAEIKQKEDRFHIYRKSEVPAHLHFSQNDRIGELVLISDAPAVFGGAGYTPSPGAHGFDATVTPSMGALFVAKGPQIKGKGRAIPPFENVHVYPYVAGILGLTLPAGIDGDSSVLKKYRKK